MVTHLVLFRLKSDAPATAAQEMIDRLRSMAGKIPTLQAMEAGINGYASERSYDVALITRFASWEDLDAYRTHPVHRDVVSFITQYVEKSRVVDFEG